MMRIKAPISMWRKGKAGRIAVVVAAGLVCLTGNVFAADPAEVARIEEDWEVQIGLPDPDNDAPQIINVISPQSGIGGPHVVFELNHQTLGNYGSGGMQLQRWDGDLDKGYCCGPKLGLLATENEVIRYTLSMGISASTLTFEVLNGTSTTWGTFGGQGYLKLSSNTTLTKLNTYDPYTSLKYSRIGFSANRVTVFVLKEVRCYAADGELLATIDGDTLTGDPVP